jgi:hypothetical protein
VPITSAVLDQPDVVGAPVNGYGFRPVWRLYRVRIVAAAVNHQQAPGSFAPRCATDSTTATAAGTLGADWARSLLLATGCRECGRRANPGFLWRTNRKSVLIRYARFRSGSARRGCRRSASCRSFVVRGKHYRSSLEARSSAACFSTGVRAKPMLRLPRGTVDSPP